MENIIDTIEKGIKFGNDVSAVLAKNKAVPLSTFNFNEVPPPAESELVFIDGSNMELFSSQSLSVQILRLAEIRCRGKERLFQNVHEAVVVTRLQEDCGQLKFFTEVIPQRGEWPDGEFPVFRATDKELATGARLVRISSVPELLRRRCELLCAERRIKSSIIVVIDGSLDSGHATENEILKNISGKVQTAQAVALGFCKTTSICTNSGRPLTSFLNSKSKLETWFTTPVGNMFFCKLHRDSRFCYRVDFFGDHKKGLAGIIPQSQDPAVPGYPYGLLLADKLARITSAEVDRYRIRIKVAAGQRWNRLSEVLESAGAHNIIDSIGR